MALTCKSMAFISDFLCSAPRGYLSGWTHDVGRHTPRRRRHGGAERMEHTTHLYNKRGSCHCAQKVLFVKTRPRSPFEFHGKLIISLISDDCLTVGATWNLTSGYIAVADRGVMHEYIGLCRRFSNLQVFMPSSASYRCCGISCYHGIVF
jgi:hypothetical protein